MDQSRIEKSQMMDDSQALDSSRSKTESVKQEGPTETSAAKSLLSVSKVKEKKILLPTLMTMVYNLGQALS